METVDWYNGSIVFTGNDNTIGCGNPICHTINWNDFFIPNNTMWTTPGSRVFPKCGFLGVPMIYSAGLHSQHPRAKRGLVRGHWFWQREQTSVRNISSSDSGKCSADRMRIVGHLHNVMSILISLMWLWLFFTSYITCNLQDATCYHNDWPRFWGWSKIAHLDDNCHLGWQCLESMVYKASILSDFRIFQVKGMY